MKKIIQNFIPKQATESQGLKIALIISIVLFGLGVLTSYILFDAANKQYTNDYEDRVSRQSSALLTHISVKNMIYEQSLVSAAGFLSVSGVDTITQTKWTEFVDLLQLQRQSPEVLGVGFSEHVSASGRPAYEQKMKSQGLTDYTIFPGGKRDAYAPVKFTKLFFPTTQTVYGYDMFADETRRTAMSRARDTGKLAVSAPVVLRNDQNRPDGKKPFGVLIYYPVYKSGTQTDTIEKRQANLLGYVYAAYRMDDMMASVAGLDKNSAYAVSDVTDKDAQLLSASSPSPSASHAKTHAQTVDVGGRTWGTQIAVRESLYQKVIQPILRFISAVLISCILSVLVFTFLVKRFKKVQTGHEEELQKTKDELLALASHQLRTPATSVRQYIGMLNLGYFGDLNPEQKSIAKKAYASNERQLEVIDQVLYVAKADSGQLMLAPELLDLKVLAKEIIDEFQDVAQEKNIALEYIASPKKVECKADRRYVRMIIENLISNAIKYSHEGLAVKVRVSATNNYASIKVIDHGVGIAHEDRSKLFQKFTRIQNPLSQKEGGSGLGLFLANKLAEAHHGKIIVDSEPEKGSSFTLKLPIKDSRIKSVVQLT